MRLRSIIIDDEEAGIETLKLVLEKHLPDVKVIAESTNARESIELIEDYRPDIVFLDISMPEMDGFELLANLKWKNFNLIFTTAHQEFALKALKQNAFDYLLKPIDYKELQTTIERIKDKMQFNVLYKSAFNPTTLTSIASLYTHKLAITSKHAVESVNLEDIISLESRSNYTLFRLSNSKTILSPKTLKEFDNLLCDNVTFMRIHHSFIVNLHKVLRFIKEDESIVMIDGQKIHLARSRRGYFIKWLSQES